ncbi:MAG: phosphoribosylformylglycinamidine synthase subunit PurS [Armatimonadota bacterium]|nr:phosphoribosylformylglycinamidine synthase subunit PurS [Armatimonadota bacterium]MDR7533591.1 phosphoribosylformylglycinamidine synthase subunit PurS [Armatimonadota bacterium]MDR7537391.1 phosphoribosylformylglycinamidine synthase subunit PurS [Armatimonadota bacterium]
MPTFRIVVMLKPGVLDAPGQAVARGLAALDFPAAQVRMGKVIELDVADDQVHRLDEMCARFLANPLIETWEIARRPEPSPVAGGGPDGGASDGTSAGAARVREAGT